MTDLDLGTVTDFALCGADGAITSGPAAFRLDRWQSGGLRFLRFKHGLTEIKHQAGGVDLVVYEQVRRHLSTDAAHAYGGWRVSPAADVVKRLERYVSPITGLIADLEDASPQDGLPVFQAKQANPI
ncbi:MAG: hypothetical protein EXR12_05390, partial [Rhodospirillaceae bacterium]|nr:hypothetical protein [Rhodospirillaceae bacterium]